MTTAENHWVEWRSDADVASTLRRLTEAIGRAGLTVFATVDHASGARAIGAAMPASTVLFYGHARGGTPVMLAAPVAAQVLPLRVLVREDADGRGIVSYQPVVALLRPFGVPEAVAATLAPAQRLLHEALAS